MQVAKVSDTMSSIITPKKQRTYFSTSIYYLTYSPAVGSPLGLHFHIFGYYYHIFSLLLGHVPYLDFWGAVLLEDHFKSIMNVKIICPTFSNQATQNVLPHTYLSWQVYYN